VVLILLKTLIFIFFAISFPLDAEEVDSYTYRNQILKGVEATPFINKLVNEKLRDSLLRTKSCDPLKLTKNIRYHFAGMLPGIKMDILKSPAMPLEKRLNDPTKTIYKNFPYLKGTCCISSMRLKNWVIGVDKIDHFFAHGLEMYIDAKAEKQRERFIQKVQEFSESQEKGMYGLQTTKVYSRADIAANLSGALFWRDFFETSQYQSCFQDKYTLKKNFDMADYVSEKWDEYYNCNDYAVKLDPKDPLFFCQKRAK
jgi:hypothetical protein